MSELLRKACAEAKEGNSNIKQQVRDIGNKFLNSVEISAQEAVYILLQLPMRKSSREVIFVNTSPPGERVELLKPVDEIQAMEDECEEIHSGGLLKRYAERPASLQNATLADWAAWYDYSKHFKKKTKTTQVDLDNFPRVIRSVWFNREVQPEKHYGELLMLFTPWRNEETDLISHYSSFQEHYLARHDEINEQMNQYAVCS